MERTGNHIAMSHHGYLRAEGRKSQWFKLEVQCDGTQKEANAVRKNSGLFNERCEVHHMNEVR
jgi:hypothetical protein